MSVDSVRTNPSLVYCVWFVGDKLERSSFDPGVLERWDDYEARLRHQASEWSRANNDYDPLAS